MGCPEAVEIHPVEMAAQKHIPRKYLAHSRTTRPPLLPWSKVSIPGSKYQENLGLRQEGYRAVTLALKRGDLRTANPVHQAYWLVRSALSQVKTWATSSSLPRCCDGGK